MTQNDREEPQSTTVLKPRSQSSTSTSQQPATTTTQSNPGSPPRSSSSPRTASGRHVSGTEQRESAFGSLLLRLSESLTQLNQSFLDLLRHGGLTEPQGTQKPPESQEQK